MQPFKSSTLIYVGLVIFLIIILILIISMFVIGYKSTKSEYYGRPKKKYTPTPNEIYALMLEKLTPSVGEYGRPNTNPFDYK